MNPINPASRRLQQLQLSLTLNKFVKAKIWVLFSKFGPSVKKGFIHQLLPSSLEFSCSVCVHVLSVFCSFSDLKVMHRRFLKADSESFLVRTCSVTFA